MERYVIFADSGCDIAVPVLADMGIRHMNLTFSFVGEAEDTAHTKEDVSPKEFYDAMRAGRRIRTFAVSIDEYRNAFAKEFEKGNDVFYLAFSSGLSSTFSAALAAAEKLKEAYPDRRAVICDSLSASAGYGMLLYLAVRKKNAGADIDELKAYCEGIRLNVCHCITVDDFAYLRREGMVGAATALVGTLFGVKPVFHIDNNGHLKNVSKVRGRKAAINTLADKLGEFRDETIGGEIFISHADCRNDANELAHMIEERYGVTPELITRIGPIIGSHSGPGTLAVFFLGKGRLKSDDR